MNILIAAGGTAGHINPAIAIADAVCEREPNSAVVFLGTPNGLEAKLVPSAGYGFTWVKMAGLQRSLSPSAIAKNVKAAWYYMSAERKIKEIIRRNRPQVVIGTGGYLTAAAIRAAHKMKIPTLVHESNSYPGLAVRMVAGIADRICLGDPAAAAHLRSSVSRSRCVTTGIPLRFCEHLPREAARKKLGLKHDFTVLSVGGSLGASAINHAVKDLLKWESDKRINHIHGFGGHGVGMFEEEHTPRRIVTEYIHNMSECMSAADVVVCRSGALTQAELKSFGRASIQVPYPYAAENHQYENALSMSRNKAAVLLEEKDLSGKRLIAEVKKFYEDPRLTAEYAENAAALHNGGGAAQICDILAELVSER